MKARRNLMQFNNQKGCRYGAIKLKKRRVQYEKSAVPNILLFFA